MRAVRERERERNNRGIKTNAPHLKYGTPRITTGKQLGENCFNLCSPPACVQVQHQQQFRLMLSSSFKVNFLQTVVFWLTFSCRQCELRKKGSALWTCVPDTHAHPRISIFVRTFIYILQAGKLYPHVCTLSECLCVYMLGKELKSQKQTGCTVFCRGWW